MNKVVEFVRPLAPNFEELLTRALESLERFCRDINEVEPYGEIYDNGNTSTVNLAIADTWYKVSTIDSAGESNGVDADAANAQLLVRKSGLYRVTFVASFATTLGNRIIQMKASCTGGSTDHPNLLLERKVTTGGDVGNAAFSGLLRIPDSTDFAIYALCVGATAVLTVKHCNFTIQWVSP